MIEEKYISLLTVTNGNNTININELLYTEYPLSSIPMINDMIINYWVFAHNLTNKEKELFIEKGNTYKIICEYVNLLNMFGKYVEEKKYNDLYSIIGKLIALIPSMSPVRKQLNELLTLILYYKDSIEKPNNNIVDVKIIDPVVCPKKLDIVKSSINNNPIQSNTNAISNIDNNTKKRTKLFYDSEFTGLHQNTTLISIGIFSECGKNFYAEFTDYDKTQVDGWIKDNIIANTAWLKDLEDIGDEWLIHNGVKDRKVLGNTKLIKTELELWLSQFDEVEFWIDTLAYDWVLFCNLWGNALSLPNNIYYIPNDLSTLFQIVEGDADISRDDYLDFDIQCKGFSNKHNALYDALVVSKNYLKLMSKINKR